MQSLEKSVYHLFVYSFLKNKCLVKIHSNMYSKSPNHRTLERIAFIFQFIIEVNLELQNRNLKIKTKFGKLFETLEQSFALNCNSYINCKIQNFLVNMKFNLQHHILCVNKKGVTGQIQECNFAQLLYTDQNSQQVQKCRIGFMQ